MDINSFGSHELEVSLSASREELDSELPFFLFALDFGAGPLVITESKSVKVGAQEHPRMEGFLFTTGRMVETGVHRVSLKHILKVSIIVHRDLSH